MSLMYLLDTDIILEPIKEKPNKRVVERIEFCVDHIAIPSGTVYKLIHDVYLLPESNKRVKTLDYIESVLIKFPILSYNEEAACWYGKEVARLQSIGKTPEFIDAQIAAIAKVHHLILVTCNIDDFKYFDGLILENWFE